MRVKLRIRIIATLLILTVLFDLVSGISVSAAGARPYNIILSWTGDTGGSVTLTWHSADRTTDSYAIYGPDKALSDAQQVKAALVEVKSGISLDAYIYRATLTGLERGRTYYYRVSDSGALSETASFTTAAANTDSFSFMYMGDIQVVSDAAKEYRDWGNLAAAAYRRNPGLAFGMLGGDIVESGIQAGQWDAFLQNASPVFSKIPLMPTNGNHESNFPGGKPELYLDLFGLPENGPEDFKEEFYSFDYGNSHITVLNSWVFSGEQKLGAGDYEKINRWIANDLNSSKALWKVVVMHHPVYALASDHVADAVKKNWEPLFKAGGVSLVFCGHQHVYSRSYPMSGGKIDDGDGIIYVMGNSGQKFYSSANEIFSDKTIYNTTTYQIVNIDGNKLTMQTFDRMGDELDYRVMSPRRAAVSPPAFKDVRGDAWYADAVKDVTDRRLMTGTSPGVFSPDGVFTRAMFATVLYHMAESPATEKYPGVPFKDVRAGQWYADAAAWAAGEGIMGGYGNGLFGSGDVLTREQLATVLYKYAAYRGYETGITHELPFFSDAEKISGWAVKAMNWAVGADFINGLPGGILAPQGVVTRAQGAVILMKFCGASAS